MSSTLRVNSITNAAGDGPVNFPNGVSGDGTNLSFTPKVISFSPGSGETNVLLSRNIIISFDQDIRFSGSGTIELRTGSSSGTVVESYAITNGSGASQLTISGHQLTINPTADLSQSTVYFLVIPNTGITNMAQTLTYPGTSSYSFQTLTGSGFSVSGGTYDFILASPSSPTGFYKYHIFSGTSPFTMSAPSASATDFTMMLLAGGGGGGGYPGSYGSGGGAGAGGLLKKTGPQWAITAGTYNMTVGAGGGGLGWPGVSPNTNGADTTITPPTAPTTYIARAYGGGAGGYEANANPPYNGNPGGSGGGSYSNSQPSYSQPSVAVGGSGVSGQGYPGGGNTHNYPGTGWGQASGGGGGAGGAGQRAYADGPSSPTSNNWYAGDGGPGVAVPEFPLSVIFAPGVIPSTVIPADTLNRHNGYYAGGGGGAGSPPGNVYRGDGGPGGGGTGSGPQSPTHPTYPSPPGYPSPTNYAQAGAQLLGGGGGGGRSSTPSYHAGNGGSGVAMIRYAVPADSF